MTDENRPHDHTEPLHTRVNRLAGADVQLFYGIVVPLVLAVGFVIAFAVTGTWWLLVATFIAVLALMAVVIVGFLQMLDQDEDNEESGP